MDLVLDNEFIEKEKAKFADIKAKPKEDFTGMKFGKLTVICRANDYHYPNGRDVSAKWHCICDCEEHNLIDVKHSHLKNGNTISCGCYQKESAQKTIRCAQTACRKPLKDNPTLELNLKDESHELFGRFKCENNDKYYVYFSMCDYELLKNYSWFIELVRKSQYIRVRTSIQNNKTMQIHQILGMCNADHINRNALDNRRENLDSKADKTTQIHNTKIRKDNTSGCKGVRFVKGYPQRPWLAELYHYNTVVLREYFKSKDEAIIARLKAEMQYIPKRAWQKNLMAKYNILIP